MSWLAVVVGGVVGAPLRYLVDSLVVDRFDTVLPWGTFTVNVSGSLLAGVVAGLGLFHGLPAWPRTALATGFCGAYTTFSTLTYETARLVEDGAYADAAANVVGSMVVGLLAAAAGVALASL